MTTNFWNDRQISHSELCTITDVSGQLASYWNAFLFTIGWESGRWIFKGTMSEVSSDEGMANPWSLHQMFPEQVTGRERLIQTRLIRSST